MSKGFVRQDAKRHIKLGSRKSKITWRRPRGTHSKMRRQRKSYPASPKVGRRQPAQQSGKIQGFTPIVVYNSKELAALGKNAAAIIASSVGAKKKVEMIKMAKEKQIKLLNVREQ